MAGDGQIVGATDTIARTAPEIDAGTLALITRWCDDIRAAKTYWKPRFDRMRQDQKFARGQQWDDGIPTSTPADYKDDRYVVNLTLRRIHQRVAAIYAKNPRVVAKRRHRMEYSVWDGTPEKLMGAMETLKTAAMGMVQAVAAAFPGAKALLDDFQQGHTQKQMLEKLGKTLETVAQYSLDEQHPRFKLQAKQLVRRVLTCGVGYIKLGYQRHLEYTSDQNARIKDLTDTLAQIEQLSADIADHQAEMDGPEAAQLRHQLDELQREGKLIRDGLLFDFPKPWQIIVDPACIQLKGFIGAGWLVHEHIFTTDKVKQIYEVDLQGAGSTFKEYTEVGSEKNKNLSKPRPSALVWEVYDLASQLSFTVCDGYPGYLKAPCQPQVQLEQWHPIYTLSFNDVEDDENIYPPSDVELMRHAQRETNRAREGNRQHRIANRPGYVKAKGQLGEIDKMKLANHADSEIIELDIAPNVKIADVLQAKPTIPISPELYDGEIYFQDIMRGSGDAEANLGGTSGATATESSIAENTRVTSVQSNIDDLDECLTDLMRGAGQILLKEMSEQTVKRIVGPGAVWPKLSAQDVAEEIYLEIKAGSSGRPNKALRLANIEKVGPYLLQVPGVKPLSLAKYLLTEMDDGIDIDDFIEDGLPSITAMNGAMKPDMQGGPDAPQNQGEKGKQNAPLPNESPTRAQNMYHQKTGATPVSNGA
jgi:hypothetical protein